MKLRMITVDPGIHTGIAIWGSDLHPRCLEISTTQKLHTEEARRALCSDFRVIVRPYSGAAIVYIEDVTLWGGSLKSLTASRKGDLFALAKLIGGYEQVCLNAGVCVISSVSVTKWKGQMNDFALFDRLRRINEETYTSPHIANAVGLGMSIRGVLLSHTRRTR
jgi:hypothetical protein